MLSSAGFSGSLATAHACSTGAYRRPANHPESVLSRPTHAAGRISTGRIGITFSELSKAAGPKLVANGSICLLCHQFMNERGRHSPFLRDLRQLFSWRRCNSNANRVRGGNRFNAACANISASAIGKNRHPAARMITDLQEFCPGVGSRTRRTEMALVIESEIGRRPHGRIRDDRRSRYV